MGKSADRSWILAIDAARRARGWERSTLAERAGVDVSTLNNWYTERPPEPGFHKIAAVCGALGISVESLLTVSESGRVASSPSNAEMFRTVASVLADAAVAAEAAAAEIEQPVPLDNTDAQEQVGA